jgi:hypothetical protein
VERINGVENARPIATSRCHLTRNPIDRDHRIRRKGHTKLLGVGGGAAGLRRLGERKGESRSDCCPVPLPCPWLDQRTSITYRNGPGPRFAPVRIGQGRAPFLASAVLLVRSEGGMTMSDTPKPRTFHRKFASSFLLVLYAVIAVQIRCWCIVAHVRQECGYNQQ